MRASKEAAEVARQDVEFVAGMLHLHYDKNNKDSKTEQALERLRQFVNVAKARLPTEASYDADRQRRVEKRRKKVR